MGYGNPARGDDGLAPAFIERLRHLNLAGVETRVEYQLCVEYALELGNYERVVFVDASLETTPPFRHALLGPDAARHLDTHGLSPGALIFLAETLFGGVPSASLLAISGYQFQPFVESLCPAAEKNLSLALEYFVGWIGKQYPRDALAGGV